MHYPLHRGANTDDLHLEHVETRPAEDGRVHIKIKNATLFNRGLERSGTELEAQSNLQPRFHIPQRTKTFERLPDGLDLIPRMNIAILITGSRGDVQPFISLGQTLQAAPYHHRVRIVTHGTFKDFVEENGLEFFNMGGDPAKLMAYMVKNPGVMPSFKSIREGDIGQRKAEIAEMLEGSWRGCTQSGNGMDKIDITKYVDDDDVLMSYPRPFVADALIANPPSYAHIHIAEKLGIPLHMMFTMPWSPTEAFPHPLANLDAANVDAKRANYYSYQKIEFLTWEVSPASANLPACC